ncbi:hypothetical protein [Paenibacillus hunanensis]|uniref:Uncharacterized protein n=1 Tax=Paenibacillus hunanensis TaxID=539262 RepID=A0ABU1IZA6_9BACL|nr:hypothetical protein [Paenibacillus hunanensis]MDR6244600.1 hypothetical protein [Paenibacillus hunanensis]GGJ23031.1 hypothetical protein GCM10008022_35000 [Paenibacillus hunanensis]
MKRIVSFLLALILFIVTCPQTFASDMKDKEFTKQDVLALEPYVSVNDNGLFELDYSKAQENGVDIELLDGQKNYFNTLNKQIESGELEAHSDLSITPKNSAPLTSNLNKSVTATCAGKSTAVQQYWWGYSRYMNSCEANKFSADLTGVSATSGGIAVIAAYFGALPAVPPGITAAYFGLLASRVSANNANSTGIYLEMTWALAFNITPQ